MVHFPAFTIKFNHTRPHESYIFVYIYIYVYIFRQYDIWSFYSFLLRFYSNPLHRLKRPPRFPLTWPTSRALVTEKNWQLQPFKACIYVLVGLFVQIYVGKLPKSLNVDIRCLKFIRMLFADDFLDCVLFLDPGKGWYSFYEVDGLSSKVLCTMLNISFQ